MTRLVASSADDELELELAAPLLIKTGLLPRPLRPLRPPRSADDQLEAEAEVGRHSEEQRHEQQ